MTSLKDFHKSIFKFRGVNKSHLELLWRQLAEKTKTTLSVPVINFQQG